MDTPQLLGAVPCRPQVRLHRGGEGRGEEGSNRHATATEPTLTWMWGELASIYNVVKWGHENKSSRRTT